MERIAFLSAAFLLCFCDEGVSRAVFLQTGDSVFLNVTETDVPAIFLILSWKFSGLNDLMISFAPNQTPLVHPNYSSRMDYDVKKYFVKLRNLQKADSGVYTAKATGFQVKTVGEYNVTVQDPVSPVQLTVTPNSSVSLSCNLTVTCSTEDAHISSTFTCDTKTCRLEGGERSQITKSAASLQVQLSGQSIICNHSNQVSWTKDVIKIQDHCIQYGGRGSSDNRNHVIVSIVCILVIVGIGFYLVREYRRRRGRYNNEQAENTVYSTPQFKPARNESRNSADDGSTLSPHTIYSMAEPQKRLASSVPETIYAQVQKTVPTNN
ncbi:SLAM family member 5-like [Menidia menidia]